MLSPHHLLPRACGGHEQGVLPVYNVACIMGDHRVFVADVIVNQSVAVSFV